MKNLVILGVPRAGKSNLSGAVSKQLALNGYAATILPADVVLSCIDKYAKRSLTHNIIRPFRHIFPFLNRHYKHSQIKNLMTFLHNFTRRIPDDKPVIFEGAYITPDTAIHNFDLNTTKIVVIGYPNAPIEQKMQDIRKYNHGTSPLIQKTDDELRARVQHYIDQSKAYQEFCKSCGITFLDTSSDYHGTINSFAENIMEFLQ